MPVAGSPTPEIATLCVAQAIMGIPSDRRFLAVAPDGTPRPSPSPLPSATSERPPLG